MRRYNDQIARQMAEVSVRFPELMEWLEEWRMSELESLPGVKEHIGTSQGRCQVLSELKTLFDSARERAA